MCPLGVSGIGAVPLCVEWWHAEVCPLGVSGIGAVCPLQQQEAGPTVVVDGDVNAEPHPLWEYPCTALSNVFTVAEFDFSLLVPHEDIMSSGTVGISEERCVREASVHTVCLHVCPLSSPLVADE